MHLAKKLWHLRLLSKEESLKVTSLAVSVMSGKCQRGSWILKNVTSEDTNVFWPFSSNHLLCNIWLHKDLWAVCLILNIRSHFSGFVESKEKIPIIENRVLHPSCVIQKTFFCLMLPPTVCIKSWVTSIIEGRPIHRRKTRGSNDWASTLAERGTSSERASEHRKNNMNVL